MISILDTFLSKKLNTYAGKSVVCVVCKVIHTRYRSTERTGGGANLADVVLVCLIPAPNTLSSTPLDNAQNPSPPLSGRAVSCEKRPNS